jgi:cell pole-organizing protein PopZ
MEEILASIRRIIADDEAKPPVPEKPAVAAAPEPAKPAARPAAVAEKPPAAAAPKPAPPKPAPPPPPPPAPAASNNQDDIDALLAGLDQVTSPEEIRTVQAAAEPEVLELTDEMAVPAPPTPTPPPPRPSFHKVEPSDDIEFAEAAAARASHRPVFDAPVFETPTAPQQAILSQSTVSAVESAFNTLAHTVLSNNARTLEDLVKEMLRPMLKSWLDDNLPGLVERIVKAEIERVSRGGR